jgi:hypothetical protein
MSTVAFAPSPPSIPGLPAEPPALSPRELFDRAAAITGSYYIGEPLLSSASPEEVVMGAIANFAGDPNISDHERGVLLAQVAEMKSDGMITKAEAGQFANEVEALTRGLIDYQP